MKDSDRDLHQRYMVVNVDGTDAPCFVLRLDGQDRHAMAALQAYAHSCRDEYPLLANDLERILADVD